MALLGIVTLSNELEIEEGRAIQRLLGLIRQPPMNGPFLVVGLELQHLLAEASELKHFILGLGTKADQSDVLFGSSTS